MAHNGFHPLHTNGASLLSNTVFAAGAQQEDNGAPGVIGSLLLTLGAAAHTVAEGVVQLQTHWLRQTHGSGQPPALRLVNCDGLSTTDNVQFAMRELLEPVCQDLAEEIRRNRLHNGHATPDDSDPLPVWLIVDVTATAPHTTLAAWARAWLEIVELAVWNGLQRQTACAVLLLAPPTDTSPIHDMIRQLSRLGPLPLYVAASAAQRPDEGATVTGPPHLAAALAALLWGEASDHAGLDHPARAPRQIYALGAAQWLSPAPMLQQALTLQWIQHLFDTLSDRDAAAPIDPESQSDAALPTHSPPTETAAETATDLHLFVSPDQVARRSEELRAVIPPLLPPQLSGRDAAGWRRTHAPIKTLLAQVNTQQTAQESAQHTARRQWLAAELSAWDQNVQRLTHRFLLGDAGAPQCAHYRAAVQELRHAAQESLSLIDDQLHAATARVTETEHAVHESARALDDTCQYLMEHRARRWWDRLVRPSLWWTWLRHRVWMLPERRTDLLHAVYARNEARMDEANMHMLRQLYLAMAQDLQRRLAWTESFAAWLDEAAALLAAEQQRVAEQLPAPWTAERLRWLWTQLQHAQLSADLDRALGLFLQQTPLETWTHHAPADLIRALQQWVDTRFTHLHGATALEWLTLAFAAPDETDSALYAHGDEPRINKYGGDAPPADGLAAWLAAFAEQARPLWPSADWDDDATLQSWLLLPAPHPDQSGSARHEDAALAALHAWCAAQPDVRAGQIGLDGLFMVRWIAVDRGELWL